MYYPKHLLVIKDKVYNVGNNFEIKEDLDKLYQEMTFDIPWYAEGSWSLKHLKMFDRVQLYFNFFTTPEKRDSASLNDMHLIFDGYIVDTPISENKTQGIQWSQILCKSTLAIFGERKTLTKFYTANIQTIMERAINELNIGDVLPGYFISNDIQESFIMKISDTNNFLEVCSAIKDKYAIDIFQAGNGYLFIQTPVFFYKGQTTIYSYDLRKNLFSIDYGNVAINTNAVCVIGTNAVGAAYDPIAYNLMAGKPVNQTGEMINSIYLRPRFVERKDLTSTEDCQQVAKNLLIQNAKNYTINFNAMFDPLQRLGDVFRIKSSLVIPPNQKWIIKTRTIIISKENINCSITGYSNGIVDFPDNILLDPSGILDTDILNISDKVESELTLG